MARIEYGLLETSTENAVRFSTVTPEGKLNPDLSFQEELANAPNLYNQYWASFFILGELGWELCASDLGKLHFTFKRKTP